MRFEPRQQVLLQVTGSRPVTLHVLRACTIGDPRPALTGCLRDSPISCRVVGRTQHFAVLSPQRDPGSAPHLGVEGLQLRGLQPRLVARSAAADAQHAQRGEQWPAQLPVALPDTLSDFSGCCGYHQPCSGAWSFVYAALWLDLRSCVYHYTDVYAASSVS